MELNRLKSVEGVDVAGQRVLVRADLNVPMRDGQVSDATRITRLLPTVRGLVERGAKVVVLSHFGRPNGQVQPDMSLAPIARTMDQAFDGIEVRFAQDCVGPTAAAAIDDLPPGAVIVLENTRFHAGEETNDPGFVARLAELGDIYVNDAFSCAHRAHASTEGIAHKCPAYAGPQLMAEINALRSALDDPQKPVAALVGGAKISTKIPVLTNLVSKVGKLIIGGGMANTFLHVAGYDVANSLCEPDLAETVLEIHRRARDAGCEILLPSDVVVAEAFRDGAPHAVRPVDDIPSNTMILDVGPETIEQLIETLADCRTILWNGPLGAFELAPFGEGTFALAKQVARLTSEGRLVSIAGGGDTVAALNAANVGDQFTYLSTAGGAFLEWLEGRTLPGIAALIGD